MELNAIEGAENQSVHGDNNDSDNNDNCDEPKVTVIEPFASNDLPRGEAEGPKQMDRLKVAENRFEIEDRCYTGSPETDSDMDDYPWSHFNWLQHDTSVRLNIAGADRLPKVEIEGIPSGHVFHHKIYMKKDENTGKPMKDQRLFYLLNGRNKKLLSIDFSSDLKSFHIMEPGSQRFIAFFTIPHFPLEEGAPKTNIRIHNVVDDEIYIVDSFSGPEVSVPIKSANGEELAVIMRPPPKWTDSPPDLLNLHFTGDEREGLTCRERAIILGFFLAIGIQGMAQLKRSPFAIIAVYVISVMLALVMIVLVSTTVRNLYIVSSNHTNSTTLKYTRS